MPPAPHRRCAGCGCRQGHSRLRSQDARGHRPIRPQWSGRVLVDLMRGPNGALRAALVRHLTVPGRSTGPPRDCAVLNKGNAICMNGCPSGIVQPLKGDLVLRARLEPHQRRRLEQRHEQAPHLCPRPLWSQKQHRYLERRPCSTEPRMGTPSMQAPASRGWTGTTRQPRLRAQELRCARFVLRSGPPQRREWTSRQAGRG